jgi:dTDP-4-amino-4,6-dideoxygalactose transaminase
VGDDAPAPRNEIMRQMQERGVSTRPGTHAVSELGYYRKHFGIRSDQYPIARMLQDQTIALPLHNRMTPADFEYVVESIHSL